MSYLNRAVDFELDELLKLAPAIALDGPKGVGKTETAKRRAKTVWFLDNPYHRQIAEADFYFRSVETGTLLLDEWQQLPQLWDSVRRQVDSGAPAGRFLLTGSATLTTKTGTHSGAGRILSLRMRPMSLPERGLVEPTVSLQDLLSGQTEVGGMTEFSLTDYVIEITNSGFPGIRSADPVLIRRQLDTYLERVIDRDLPELGAEVRRPETLRRWLAAYAAATSTTTAYSRLLDATTARDGTQPAKTTTLSYREHLTRLWLLDPVPGWLPANNPFRRLQQAPKHQLADPALAVRLLGFSTDSLLDRRGAHMLGPLFESLATLSVRIAAQVSEAKVYHLRVNGGQHEIDLIVQGTDGRLVAIEVKLSPVVTDADVQHLHWLRDQLGEQVADLVVITTGPTAYRRTDGIAVIPLALLGV